MGAKVWPAAVFEDSFGFVVAVDDEDGRHSHAKKWVMTHFERELPYTARYGFACFFAKDDDPTLDDEVLNFAGKPALAFKCGKDFHITPRESRNILTQFLEDKGMRWFITEAKIGDSIFDIYALSILEDKVEQLYLGTEGYRTGTFIPIDERRLNIIKRQLTLIDMPWYDYVSSDLVYAFGQDSTPDEIKTIGRHLLSDPKFEQRFNEIHAKYSTPATPAPAAAAPAIDQAPKSASYRSKQQTYAIMMAPNGRCPKCNCPFKTRQTGLSSRKAALGGILAGPVGAIVGASNGKTEYYCPDCSYVR